MCGTHTLTLVPLQQHEHYTGVVRCSYSFAAEETKVERKGYSDAGTSSIRQGYIVGSIWGGGKEGWGAGGGGGG